MPHPFALAIETSQRGGGAALRGTDGSIDVEMLREATRHDDDLLPAIDRLCRRHGAAPGDIGLVGVCVGPGGFTGLRIAVSTAKMLGETTGCALVAVPAAHAIAEVHADDDGPVLVALAVKGDTFWGTTLERIDGAWTTPSPPGLVDAATLDAGALTAVIADRYLPDAARGRCAAAGTPVVPLRLEPAAVLTVAERRACAGDVVDPVALRPIYPRQPEAVRLWTQTQR